MGAMRAAAVPSLAEPPPPPPRWLRRRSPAPSQPPVPFPEDTARTPRRAALALLLLLPAAASPPSAAALSLGIPGPKEWLKEQKRKAARFVLAPIAASRQSLHKAYLLLTESGSGENPEEVRRLLNSAYRDCIPEQRSSLVALQSRTGVEVCTYSLILKNASSLLDDKDPIKQEAEARLVEVIRSLSNLGNIIGDGNFQVASDRDRMEDGLLKTISVLDRFEQGVKDCLGI